MGGTALNVMAMMWLRYSSDMADGREQAYTGRNPKTRTRKNRNEDKEEDAGRKMGHGKMDHYLH